MATAEWFPFQYRPVQQWHAVGLPITTPSDEAAKFLDSALAQMILMDSDTQMGGMEEAWKKAMQADPDFFFAKVVMATMEVQGSFSPPLNLCPFVKLVRFNLVYPHYRSSLQRRRRGREETLRSQRTSQEK